MTTRYDAVAVRKYSDRDGNEKTAYTNVGVAWPMKEKDGFSVKLHAIPAPENGEYTILLMVPRPKEDGERPAAQRTNTITPNARSRVAERPLREELDDEIPF